MPTLSEDSTFHFELLRVLGSARYGAADVGEVLDAADRIRPGDFESWTEAFGALAEAVEASVDGGPSKSGDTSVRDVMFRAANYWRSADFFIHGDIHDPRIQEYWDAQTRCFDKAIARLPVPGVRFEVPIEGSRVLGTFYRAADDATSRPTLLMFNGFDGGQEELAHISGFSALERGINVVTFEGPGQPAVRRKQGVGFIMEWEKVVTPVVDHVLGLQSVDANRLGLLGNSFGGFLAPRAAAFEPRLAALICIDGVFDAHQAFIGILPDAIGRDLRNGDREAFNAAIRHVAAGDTNMRWVIEQGTWAFKKDSPFEMFRDLEGYTLAGIADRIACPVFIGDAQQDRFFEGQPERLAGAIGDRATLHKFSDTLSAGLHCQVGAAVEMNRAMLDWFVETVK